MYVTGSENTNLPRRTNHIAVFWISFEYQLSCLERNVAFEHGHNSKEDKVLHMPFDWQVISGTRTNNTQLWINSGCLTKLELYVQ